MTSRTILIAFVLAGSAALAGCNRGADAGNNVAALDNQLVANQADAALTGALGNQIAVDPAVANGSKPAADGQAEAAKATPGAIDKARLALNGADHKGCASDAAKLDTGNQWADRLPAAFGAYPGAKVVEAAANNADGCSVRIVNLTTSDDWQRVLDWYNTRAVKGGYTTEHRVEGADHVLGGTNAKDGGAYFVAVTPGKGGSEVAFVADKGR
ncbi:MAG: hypothetical protein JO013_08380 [Alphaproteobacteria bacterium]|nr:hypothetical protein [Alphaproteobacteria bacterium]